MNSHSGFSLVTAGEGKQMGCLRMIPIHSENLGVRIASICLTEFDPSPIKANEPQKSHAH